MTKPVVRNNHFFTYDKCNCVQKSYTNWKIPKSATESILYTNQVHNTKYNIVDNNVYNELCILNELRLVLPIV